MNAGDLRNRITIQQRVTGQDSYGQPVDSWQDVAVRWAAIEPLQGREILVERQVNAEVTTRIRLRYLAGVRPAMRIVYNGRLFDIQAVIDRDERHEELQLMCREMM